MSRNRDMPHVRLRPLNGLTLVGHILTGLVAYSNPLDENGGLENFFLVLKHLIHHLM